jgi:hypothetical protein
MRPTALRISSTSPRMRIMASIANMLKARMTANVKIEKTSPMPAMVCMYVRVSALPSFQKNHKSLPSRG